MLDPYFRGDFDPDAFPVGLRAASVILTALVLGALLIEAAATTVA